MNWWHYLILANLYLAMFYGFYLLLLRKETYFMLNRIYLVSAAILSFFIPMMQLEWVKNLFITQKVQHTIYYIDPGFVYQVSPQTNPGFTVAQFFTTLYWLVALLLLARLYYRFLLLRQLMQQDETGRAYSFFGKIKVDENLPQTSTIYKHETVHAAHMHSVDVLLFEFLTILNWFNPIIYFYRKSIKHNHEFIADRDAISFGIDKSDYAMLLLSETMGVQPNLLVNSFFNHSLLKQRIIMLHKNPSKRSALLKYGLSAPLFGLMLIFTSATISEQKAILKLSNNISSDASIKEVAVDLSNQINVLPGPPAALKLPIAIIQKLKGKVVSINGEPLAGVKILYDKKSITVDTDKDGDFSISNYTEGDFLTFEFANYNTVAKSFADVKGKLPVIVLQGSNHHLTLIAKTVNKFADVRIDADTTKAVSFASVEKLPFFPGGEVAFGNYLAKSIRYPKDARDQKITGRVIVSFIVEKDGKLNDIKVLRDIGGGAGAEAVRVLSKSPDWNPGIQDGKPVRVAYTMPVNFTIADEGNRKTPNQRTVKFMNEDSVIKRGRALNMGNGTLTISGFGGKDSARQRPLTDVIRIQTKIMNIEPIYMIDGKEVDKSVLQATNPNDIESISFWKGEKAVQRFGDKGKNGIIEITSKAAKKQ